MRRKNKFKYMFLLSAFILASNTAFSEGNSSDSFNGSNTAIESIGANIGTNSMKSSGVTTFGPAIKIPGLLSNPIKSLSNFLDFLEGGSNPETNTPTQGQQNDLFSQPLSIETEATTGIETVTEASNLQETEKPAEISDTTAKASKRDYY